MARDPPVARDKPTDPQPRGKGQDGRSLTYNVTPTPFNTSTATPTPTLPESTPLLLRQVESICKCCEIIRRLRGTQSQLVGVKLAG